MALNLSYSAVNKFTSCGKSYEFSYIERIRPIYKGSALYFGSAMDVALNFMLLNLDAPDIVNLSYEEFLKAWTNYKELDGTVLDLKNYTKVLYSKSDFDAKLLSKEDWSEIYQLSKDPNKTYADIKSKLDSNHFSELPDEDKIFYTRVNWLSLKQKAAYMIQAYHRDIVPMIEEVLEVQKPIELEDEAGNKIKGFVDLVCKLKNGLIVVADNKTSSVEYEDDSVSTSAQLAQYKSILNAVYNYEIKHGCYFVISKKLSAKKVCCECGFESTGSHKTCNNILNGERCGGEWDETPFATAKIFVEEIPDGVTNMVLENFDVALKSIESGLFTRNFSNCHGKFGKCEYIDYCFKNKDSLLERAGGK